MTGWGKFAVAPLRAPRSQYALYEQLLRALAAWKRRRAQRQRQQQQQEQQHADATDQSVASTHVPSPPPSAPGKAAPEAVKFAAWETFLVSALSKVGRRRAV